MDKLQELTDRLYNEGLSKGKAEGEAILAKAREDAAAMVDEARKKAEQIILKAEKDAEDLRTKAESDVRTASLQALQATRQDLETLVVAKVADTQVKDALSAPEFIKGIITAVAKNFSAQEQSDIAMVLPESLKAQLEPFLRNELGNDTGQLGIPLNLVFYRIVAFRSDIAAFDGIDRIGLDRLSVVGQ